MSSCTLQMGHDNGRMLSVLVVRTGMALVGVCSHSCSQGMNTDDHETQLFLTRGLQNAE